MSMYEKYMEYEKIINRLEEENRFDEAQKLEDEQIEFRDNSFTKEDWEHLIADTNNGRAKYEYTRMMNERFPDKSK